ncbi:MAG: HAD hydrolase-like protein, partial [Clostridia bacterium]|nr:HAD hydrolase-like protein [Clostridia bacterium]MBQ8136579.1 HAD hydrolase-like protein [Clostridia bacterium]
LLREYRPKSAVMIGDCTCDMEAGKKNGLRTIGAAYGYGKKEEWSSADDIAYTVGDVAALAKQRAGDFR